MIEVEYANGKKNNTSSCIEKDIYCCCGQHEDAFDICHCMTLMDNKFLFVFNRH